MLLRSAPKKSSGCMQECVSWSARHGGGRAAGAHLVAEALDNGRDVALADAVLLVELVHHGHLLLVVRLPVKLVHAPVAHKRREQGAEVVPCARTHAAQTPQKTARVVRRAQWRLQQCAESAKERGRSERRGSGAPVTMMGVRWTRSLSRHAAPTLTRCGSSQIDISVLTAIWLFTVHCVSCAQEWGEALATTSALRDERGWLRGAPRSALDRRRCR